MAKNAINNLNIPMSSFFIASNFVTAKTNESQCPEMILIQIEKTFNKTYTGLKSFLQRCQICFSQNPSSKGSAADTA